MKKLLISLFCTIVALMCVACGEDNTTIAVIDHYDIINVLDSGKSLSEQDCDSSNVGEILFAKDSGEVFVCNGKEWLSMKGANGEKGDDGAKGKTGDKGPSGDKGAKGETGDAGKTGRNGSEGTDGIDGTDGAGCQVIEDVAEDVVIACGEQMFSMPRNMCGTKIYNPAEKFCVNEKLYDASEYFLDERDNHVYRTITIGNGKNTTTWMAENLNYDYNVGSAQSVCYDNNIDYCTKYGRLYTWSAAVDSAGLFSTDCKGCGDYYERKGEWVKAPKEKKLRGVCPVGWHLPDTLEFNALRAAASDSVRMLEGKYPEYVNQTINLRAEKGWVPDIDSTKKNTDRIGFSATPAGYGSTYNFNTAFISEGSYVGYWASIEAEESVSWRLSLWNFDYTTNLIAKGVKGLSYSVRCVKD